MVKMSASWAAVATWTSRIWPVWTTSCEVLPDVDVLGTLPAPDDVVPPLDAHSVVLVHRSRRFLGEAHVLEEVAKVDDLRHTEVRARDAARLGESV